MLSPSVPELASSDIEVRRFTQELSDEWDAFVFRSNNGTFLHSRSFFDSNPANAKDDHSLLFYRKGKLVCLLAAATADTPNGSHFESHSRSTYGGYVFGRGTDAHDALNIVASTIHYLRHHSIRSATIRSPFRIIADAIDDVFEYAMWRNGFAVSQRQIELYLPLRNGDGLDCTPTRRRDIGRAYKDTAIAEESLHSLAEYWPILESNLQESHHRTPVHDLPAIQRLIEHCGEDKFRFFAARIAGQMVAGTLLFIPRSSVAHAQYIAQDSRGRSAKATSGVLDCAAKWARDAGMRCLNLGTPNEGGLVLNKGLADFKTSFGAIAVLREDHRWEDSV